MIFDWMTLKMFYYPYREASYFMFQLKVLRTPQQHRHPLVSATCLCLLSFSFATIAAPEDEFSPYFDSSVIQEDNLLRFHDAAAAMEFSGSTIMADTIKSATAGLRVNKVISQQSLKANLSTNQNHFDHFSQYDYTGKNLSANWGWRIGSQLSGNLGGDYLEEQSPFRDFRTLEPNINRQRRENFDAAWQFHPSWRLRSAYSQYALTYDLAAIRYNDRALSTSELGLDFVRTTNSTIGLQMRQTHGEYPNSLSASMSAGANNYVQNEFKGKIDWHVSENSSIEFLGGPVRKNYDVSDKRNFSGGNSRLIGKLSPSAKLKFIVNAWNEVGSSNDLSANYSSNQGASGSADWGLSSKIKMNASLRTEQRDYTSVNTLTDSQSLGRKDTYSVASLGLNYMPIRHLNLSASIAKEVLKSNIERNGYSDNRFQLGGVYDFGLEQ